MPAAPEPAIRKTGYFYCERCLYRNKVTGGVPLYKRIIQDGWPIHIDWEAACPQHSRGRELYCKNK